MRFSVSGICKFHASVLGSQIRPTNLTIFTSVAPVFRFQFNIRAVESFDSRRSENVLRCSRGLLSPSSERGAGTDFVAPHVLSIVTTFQYESIRAIGRAICCNSSVCPGSDSAGLAAYRNNRGNRARRLCLWSSSRSKCIESIRYAKHNYRKWCVSNCWASEFVAC
jgi:hypothetical protein